MARYDAKQTGLELCARRRILHDLNATPAIHENRPHTCSAACNVYANLHYSDVKCRLCPPARGAGWDPTQRRAHPLGVSRETRTPRGDAPRPAWLAWPLGPASSARSLPTRMGRSIPSRVIGCALPARALLPASSGSNTSVLLSRTPGLRGSRLGRLRRGRLRRGCLRRTPTAGGGDLFIILTKKGAFSRIPEIARIANEPGPCLRAFFG